MDKKILFWAAVPVIILIHFAVRFVRAVKAAAWEIAPQTCGFVKYYVELATSLLEADQQDVARDNWLPFFLRDSNTEEEENTLDEDFKPDVPAADSTPFATFEEWAQAMQRHNVAVKQLLDARSDLDLDDPRRAALTAAIDSEFEAYDNVRDRGYVAATGRTASGRW
jgi:hypothetical protein